eukprot:jgi/Orpsp1_1/1176499/evm.model.c7180000057840.1
MYNEINRDNEEIEKFMESVFKKENLNFEKFLGKPLEEVIDSLGKKLSSYGSLCDEDFIELCEFDNLHRKLFLICYYLWN